MLRTPVGSPIARWPGRCINVRRCGGLPMLLLLLKDLVELLVKRREFLADSGFLHRSVESDVHSDFYLHVHNQHT